MCAVTSVVQLAVDDDAPLVRRPRKPQSAERRYETVVDTYPARPVGRNGERAADVQVAPPLAEHLTSEHVPVAISQRTAHGFGQCSQVAFVVWVEGQTRRVILQRGWHIVARAA